MSPPRYTHLGDRPRGGYAHYVILVVFVALVVIFVLLPLIWHVFWLVVWAVISGLFFGGLGRLIVPGRNPIGLLPTVACGLVGSLVGLGIGQALSRGRFVTILIEIGLAAGAVALWDVTHRSAIGGARRPISR
jgi:uncharacterized membrane protein YeaQ/YmgE (transglycosylase-associated protein family)